MPYQSFIDDMHLAKKNKIKAANDFNLILSFCVFFLLTCEIDIGLISENYLMKSSNPVSND